MATFSEADEFGNINVSGMPSMGGMGGGGGSIESLIYQNTINAASVVEKQIDRELNKLDNLTEKELIEIRLKRVSEMKKRSELEQEWRLKGHGRYEEIGDEKQWFDENKLNQRVITHFYRSATWRCEIVDKHLQILAAKHIETKFIKIDAEKSPFLAQRLNIVLLPTIICTKDNKVLDMIEGFDELGGTDQFTTAILEARLGKKGSIDYDPMELEMKSKGNNNKNNNKNNKENDLLAEKNYKIRKGKTGRENKVSGLSFNRRVANDDDEDSEEDDD